jgi:CBS domain containing-hemolysin-like protein
VNPRVSRALSVAIITFFMAIAVSFVSKILLGRVGLILGLFVLLFIVGIGVIFDVIGTATTAAKERPLNAMASKKVYGAKQGLRMTRSADRVASFCNDIIGDMTGTVSGAIGAAIALELVVRAGASPASETVVSTVIIGIIAALTVGGKAWGKNAAISESERIVLAVGRVLAWLEDSIGLVILPDRKAVNRKRNQGPAKTYTEGDSNSGKTS